MKRKEIIEVKEDNYAAIGIGAMIVFISLILVAAVASAVIIQTAEKLQQNAQTAGDDTSDELSEQVNVVGGYLDDAANDNYVLLVKLAAGSDRFNQLLISWQLFCDAPMVMKFSRSG